MNIYNVANPLTGNLDTTNQSTYTVRVKNGIAANDCVNMSQISSLLPYNSTVYSINHANPSTSQVLDFTTTTSV